MKNFLLSIKALIALLVISSGVSFAGEFRVTPIRLEFSKGVKSGLFTIANEGDRNINMQITAMEWTQDDSGKDIYTETSDIIYYPKIMTLTKGEKRALRVGIKAPLIQKEKTYRLFIEEIPEPKAKEPGMTVSVTLRFGAPLFVKPLKEELKGEITKLELLNGTLSISVKNSGNVHFVINSIVVSGKNPSEVEIFSKEIAGWYLLAGASRTYITPIPPDTCKTLKRFDIEIKAPEFNIKNSIETTKEMCSE